LLKISNVEVFQKCAVTRLLYDGPSNTVTGISVRKNGEEDEEEIFADFIVDCSGSNSTSISQLKGFGIEVAQDRVDAGVGYTSGFYKLDDPIINGVHAKIAYVQASPDHGEIRGVVMGELEDGLYHVNWYGYNKDYPPATDEGLIEYSRSLRVPEIVDIMKKATRVGPLIPFRNGCTERIRCERSQNWPENFIILGDSMAHFTPIYGQGMTFGALSAKILQKILSESSSLRGLPKKFFKEVQVPLELCWNAAAGEDMCVQGATSNVEPPKGFKFFHAYLGYALRLVCEEELPHVFRRIAGVMHMTLPPYHVLHPSISLRVLRYYLLDLFSPQKK